jgi:hypothetical protein
MAVTRPPPPIPVVQNGEHGLQLAIELVLSCSQVRSGELKQTAEQKLATRELVREGNYTM